MITLFFIVGFIAKRSQKKRMQELGSSSSEFSLEVYFLSPSGYFPGSTLSSQFTLLGSRHPSLIDSGGACDYRSNRQPINSDLALRSNLSC